MGFVHLQANSGYTFMQSTLSIDKLVKGAKAAGYSKIALTDQFVMHGSIQFYEQCIKEGIKPIIGLKIDVKLDDTEAKYEVILLAKSNKGYEALVKLSTHFAHENFEATFVDKLENKLEDIFVILPAFQHKLGHTIIEQDIDKSMAFINQWENIIAKENFYLGVQNHGFSDEYKVNDGVKQLCEKGLIKAVAIHDVRYLNEEDYVAYDCFQYMREGKHWSSNKDMTTSKHRNLVTEEEMINKFPSWPEVIKETEIIADQCQVEMDFNEHYLPAFPTPDGMKASDYLREKCEQNLIKKYDDINMEAAKHRLQYELNIIEGMGFSDYFLIVWDFIKYAKEHQILTGPGRGSAAGSIVAYLMDITEVDPIKYNLLFERFLNPERTNMPDIDIDFSDYRRDEVIYYVQQKYGSDHVAQIITFGTFATRSLLRELMKTMSIDEQDAKFLLKEISHHTPSLSNALKESDELFQYVKQSNKLQLLFNIASKLEGLPRHHSTHAAGVVISAKPLSTIVPTIPGSQNVDLTQYPMKDLEKIGLLKMDFLGLRNLSLIEQIVKRIEKDTNTSFALKNIHLDDKETYELLQEGKTTGVFQLESRGMRRVLMDLKPTTFEDIVAVNALYRPGPMDFIPNFIARKHGKEKIVYPHPDLKNILESTFGVLVYQEQIMQIAHEFAGLSLGDADLLRRAVSKKKKDIIEQEKERFIAGCLQNGYGKKVGEEIYEWIVRFANYGFNRSHAVAYSMISYQLAYLRVHFPSHFFAALLSSVTYDQDKVSQYVKEAKDAGIKILPPSINKSFAMFTAEGKNSIRMALPVIKGIGKSVVEVILSVRKNKSFQSLFDFCQRVPLKTINRGVLENLILAGCFDETYENRATLLASIEQAMEQAELFGGLDGQSSLFEDDFFLEPSYTMVDPFPALKQLSYEKEVLGMYLSSHPLSTFRQQLRSNGFLSLDKLIERYVNKRVKAIVAIQHIKVIRTKRGEQMAFVTVADETDEMEGVIFPNQFREAKPWVHEEMLLQIDGKIERRNDQDQFVINALQPFQPKEIGSKEIEARLYIKLRKDDERLQLQFLSSISEDFPGSIPIVVHSPIRKETYQLASSYNVNPTNLCLKKLKDFFGNDYVVLQKVK